MKLQAHFHGLELNSAYDKPRLTWSPALGAAPCNALAIAALKDLSPVPLSEFQPAGLSRTTRDPEFTYQRLVDLHTRRISPADDDHALEVELKRLIIHGEGCRVLFDDHLDSVQRILSSLPSWHFYPFRIDINIDISADFVPFKTINDHFLNDNLTKSATSYPYTDPQGNRSWYVGRKPASGQHGCRLSFYESGKRHPEELPPDSWRIEAQIHGKEALRFVKIFLDAPTQETLTAYLLQQLKEKVTFRTPSADGNKSRWPVCRWWTQLIAGAGNFSEHRPVTMPVREEKRKAKALADMKALYARLGEKLFFSVREEFDNILLEQCL